MKKLLLLTIFFYCGIINAQISFEKGYFILNNGTKVDCFIKNSDWKNNPTDFKYKKQISDTEYQTETISNVQEFSMDNFTTFKKFKVKIDRSSDDLEKISQTGKPVWEDKTLFLRTLVQGEATLYSFTEDNLIRYFYETKNIPLEQLVHLKYIQLTDGKSSENLEENNYFRQQLHNNVRSANTEDRDIEKLKYKKSDLIKYFIHYNNIETNTTTTKELSKTTKGFIAFKITPEISLISLTMNDGDAPSQDVKMDGTTNFKIGLELEYVLPFNKNKWSLFLNPAYQKYSNTKTYSKPGAFANSPQTVRAAEIKYTSIQFPVGLRHYLFMNANSKIFINAAYSFDISGKASISFDNNVTNESKSGSNFAFGIGYNFKNKYSAEVRMNTKKQLLGDYQSFSANYGAIDFVLGYTLF